MKKFLGQHFLKNQKAIADIVAAVEVTKGDYVIEIGPGAGALTDPLAKLCQERGAKLLAIEKDTRLVIDIQKEIPFIAGHVEHGDALTLLPALVDRLEGKKYKLVGNIPYYITGHLLRIIGELSHLPEKTVLMVQKEVAERVSAKPPSMNLLAAATQYWGDVSMLLTLKPKDFAPPPEVSSAVISITPRANLHTATRNSPSASAYYRFVKAIFKQPRKTLINNLAEGFPQLTRQKIADFMRENRLPLTTRAQDLDTSRLKELTGTFFQFIGA